ncbi:MAG: galactosamine-6-phosphate isomerase [Bacteroidales bacterium]|nr:galactosamine-6-phosphate isomerase [Bacteroidales bacterium]
MNITFCRHYGEMSHLAASLVLEDLIKEPGLLLCAASGNSPEGLYRELAAKAGSDKELCSRLRILKLDEWGGIPENHPVSCEYFIRKKLLDPLGIPMERYITFRSDPVDPETECQRIRSRLDKEGPIDICILGLGRNGHLGLNEPAPELELFCHVARLTTESLSHPMLASLDSRPAFGLTLGIKDILASRKIIMLVSGPGKKQVAEKFLKEQVSSELPASFLWLHPRVECLVDRTALD